MDVRIRASHSLKDKRTALRPLLEGLRRRFAVSVAEVDHQDLLQRSGIAVAAVQSSAGQLDGLFAAVERFIWSFPDLEVIASDRHWIEVEAEG